jgi:flagellar biosynthesis component FlhA
MKTPRQFLVNMIGVSLLMSLIPGLPYMAALGIGVAFAFILYKA